MQIKKFVIVGGGTAGWMAAAYLARRFDNIDITLVESELIGTVGVGEATVPAIRKFIKYLGVKESEFIKSTNATFKLGIKFEGWAGPGTSFFHPFARYGVDIENFRPFYKTWYAARAQGYTAELDEFCLCTQLAKERKFAQPGLDNNSRLASYNYAYHFDASLFAKYLRGYAEQRRVKRVDGKITGVHLDPHSGYIQSLQLESGECIEGDLFVDCSGFNALMIEKALCVQYEDWSHWLPCDSAIAVQTKIVDSPDPFTSSVARSAGWQWYIPLQHRAGNGYVYSSRHTTNEQALADLLANLRGEPLTEPRLIRFTTGIRKNFWYKNCVAIGLSSGFLEPLESTSISLIQTGIDKLVDFLVNFEIDEKSVAEANRLNRLEYERIRDFIILHYKLNRRSEPLWQQVREMPIPETLAEKIEVFTASGDVKLLEQESFVEASWISMFYGFGLSPLNLSASQNAEQLRIYMEKMRLAIIEGSRYALSHRDFLQTLP